MLYTATTQDTGQKKQSHTADYILMIRITIKYLSCSLLLAFSCPAASAWSLLRPDNKKVSSSDISRGHFLTNAVQTAAAASIIVGTCLPAACSAEPALPLAGEIESAIPSDWNGVENPFEGGGAASQFARLDSTPDSRFYSEPRFVEHVDDNAVRVMTKYIGTVVGTKDVVLDLCSSWTSHLLHVQPQMVVGLGMNEKELSANPSLTSWNVQDLNEDPHLPYPENTFSVVLCQLSIDYLTRPLEVLAEVGRVLRPGGTIHILFSNRLFLSKAVGIWTGADDIDHAYTVACYLHFSKRGLFENIVARDLSTRRNNRIIGDPVYVVMATKCE